MMNCNIVFTDALFREVKSGSCKSKGKVVHVLNLPNTMPGRNMDGLDV
jgi:hypothetical protein